MIKRGLLAVILGATPMAAHADAWETFVTSCLDPYEHLSFEITGELSPQPIDPMHDARITYGPDATGDLLVVDAAPTQGERSCTVVALGKERSRGALEWMVDQLLEGRYVPGDDGWIYSNEWIEPQLKLRVTQSKVRTVYSVVETDLES